MAAKKITLEREGHLATFFECKRDRSQTKDEHFGGNFPVIGPRAVENIEELRNKRYARLRFATLPRPRVLAIR